MAAARVKPPVYSVTAVNNHISSLFSDDSVLSHIYVRGELSNVKYASSGHLYFSLKDEKSQIRCAMWSSSVKKLKTRLKDGDSVTAYGQIAVYERDGIYQFYVTAVRPEKTTGQLYEQFEKLRDKLLEEGMFDAMYKKTIPAYVRTLGVVTAPTGAAVRDIINVSRRRNPGIRIFLYPARVQGDGAADSVARGIETLDSLGVCDVIIVGRGGGSIEDLWAFNEEKVADAIWRCSTPVISAVGHETDTTIADFVADLRAPTPSAGAELAVSDMRAALIRLDDMALRLRQLMKQHEDMNISRLRQCVLSLKAHGPEGRLTSDIQFIARAREKMDARLDAIMLENQGTLERRTVLLRTEFDRRMQSACHRLEISKQHLAGLSPQSRLDAGYAYIEDEKGRGISSAGALKKGDTLTVRLRDGSARTKVSDVYMDREYVIPELS